MTKQTITLNYSGDNGKTADEQATQYTKEDMVNVLVILLDMDGFESQLSKLSLPALRALFEGTNKNAAAYNLAKNEARWAREHQQVAERRADSFERDLKRLKGKKK